MTRNSSPENENCIYSPVPNLPKTYFHPWNKKEEIFKNIHTANNCPAAVELQKSGIKDRTKYNPSVSHVCLYTVPKQTFLTLDTCLMNANPREQNSLFVLVKTKTDSQCMSKSFLT